MRILAYTSPARGHLYPVVPIMAELAARGHHATICTLSSELDPLAELGIEAVAIDPRVEQLEVQDWRERTLPQAMRSTLRTFAERAEHDAEDLARAIERHDPDVLLIDVLSWGAAAVAEASGRPWAIFCPFLMQIHSREAPPFGMGLKPRSGPLGAVRDTIARRAAELMSDRAAMPTVNALRARQGLASLQHHSELLQRAPLVLGLTAEGFEYPRSDWPANVRLIGAVSWAPAQQEPGWLDELGDPLVLVTCSTERQRDKRLIHMALQALPASGRSVIATSAAHDPDQFHAPPGSRVVRFLAHEQAIERAACVVCHGGMGITQKALAAGVPVVVVPFARDQFETARRVEYAQAGVRVLPRRLSAERLVQAVDLAIELRAGARGVSEAFERAGGAAAGAEAIEALAASAGAQAATESS